MIAHDPPTRRTFLQTAGASLLLAAWPAAAIAAPVPTLEDIFGAERIAILRAMFRARFGLISDWREYTMLDPHGRFRASPPLRIGLSAFIRDHAPFELVYGSAAPGGTDFDRWYVDLGICSMFGHADLFPPDTYCELVAFDDRHTCWRYWTGDVGRAAHWPPHAESLEPSTFDVWPQLAEPGRHDLLHVRRHPRRNKPAYRGA